VPTPAEKQTPEKKTKTKANKAAKRAANN
jgi:hypothetical protein